MSFFGVAAAAPAAGAAAGVCALTGFSAPAAAPATAAPAVRNFLRLGVFRSIAEPPSARHVYTPDQARVGTQGSSVHPGPWRVTSTSIRYGFPSAIFLRARPSAAL